MAVCVEVYNEHLILKQTDLSLFAKKGSNISIFTNCLITFAILVIEAFVFTFFILTKPAFPFSSQPPSIIVLQIKYAHLQKLQNRILSHFKP